jgi:hypothetical protein
VRPPRPPTLQVLSEYVYVADTATSDLHSTTVVLPGPTRPTLAALPRLELHTEVGEVYLVPRTIFPDPLRGGPHVLVLCEAFAPPSVRLPAGRPLPRARAAARAHTQRPAAHAWVARGVAFWGEAAG